MFMYNNIGAASIIKFKVQNKTKLSNCGHRNTFSSTNFSKIPNKIHWYYRTIIRNIHVEKKGYYLHVMLQ